MRQINFLILVVALVVYAYAVYAKFYIPNNSWINHYLADVVALPLVLSAGQLGVSFLKKLPEFRLSVLKVVVAVLYISILFEFVLPYINPEKFTQDFTDLLMYCGGGAIYFILVCFIKR